MQKVKKFFSSAVNIFFSLCSLCTVILILIGFNKRFVLPAYPDIKITLLFILLIVLCTFLVYFLYKKSKLLQNLLTNHPYAVLAWTVFVVFIVQAVLLAFAHTPIGWDCYSILGACDPNLSESSALELDKYFATYPNNILMTALFKLFSKVAIYTGMTHVYASILLNCIFLDLGFVFLCLSAKLLGGNKFYYFSMWIELLFLAFNPQISIPYSDTMALPFTTGFLFFAILFKKTESTAKKCLYMFFCGLSLFVGYRIKPTVLIVGIATLVWLVLSIHIPKKRDIKHILCTILPVLCLCVSVLLSNCAFTISKSILYYDKESANAMAYHLEFPMSHFLMMGLNENEEQTYFGFFQEDVNQTKNIDGKNEKTEMHKAVIRERLENYSFARLCKHLLCKATWVTTDGAFFYGGEGHFHADVPQMEGGIAGFLQNWNYSDSDFYQKYLVNYMQAAWALIVFGMFLNIFINRKKLNAEQETFTFITQLTYLGLILFLMIFEARSRYIFLFLPYTFLLAVQGYTACFTFLKSKASRIQNTKKSQVK